MSTAIPQSHINLLERPVIANLSTILPDGRPQVHPVWCDYDGQYVRINSQKGRQKDKNLRRRRYATILLIEPGDPYTWLEIRGRVVKIVEGEEAEEHIHKLARDYENAERFENLREGAVRVIYQIEPERVLSRG